MPRAALTARVRGWPALRPACGRPANAQPRAPVAEEAEPIVEGSGDEGSDGAAPKALSEPDAEATSATLEDAEVMKQSDAVRACSVV